MNPLCVRRRGCPRSLCAPGRGPPVSPAASPGPSAKMNTEIKRLELELEKARNGLAMPYDRERVWQLEAHLREARQKVRMRKAKQMALAGEWVIVAASQWSDEALGSRCFARRGYPTDERSSLL